MKYSIIFILTMTFLSCDNFYEHYALKGESNKGKRIVAWVDSEASIKVSAKIYKDNTLGTKENKVVFKINCEVGKNEKLHFLSNNAIIKMNQDILQTGNVFFSNSEVLKKREFVIYGVIPKEDISTFQNKKFELQLPNISHNNEVRKIDPVVFIF